jgi:hypothetical protein
VTSRALEKSDAMVARTATALTRRRAFRNAGATALGLAMGTAYFGRRPDVAAACEYSAICGPSPKCKDPEQCNGYHCADDRSVVNYALWGPNSQPCAPQSADNCWTTCVNGDLYRCCDCCRKDPDCQAGAICTGCGSGTWRKCSCHKKIDDHC